MLLFFCSLCSEHTHLGDQPLPTTQTSAQSLDTSTQLQLNSSRSPSLPFSSGLAPPQDADEVAPGDAFHITRPIVVPSKSGTSVGTAHVSSPPTDPDLRVEQSDQLDRFSARNSLSRDSLANEPYLLSDDPGIKDASSQLQPTVVAFSPFFVSSSSAYAQHPNNPPTPGVPTLSLESLAWLDDELDSAHSLSTLSSLSSLPSTPSAIPSPHRPSPRKPPTPSRPTSYASIASASSAGRPESSAMLERRRQRAANMSIQRHSPSVSPFSPPLSSSVPQAPLSPT